MEHRSNWIGRIAWGGVAVLGAAAAMGSPWFPNLPGWFDDGHEFPLATWRNPDRAAEAPAELAPPVAEPEAALPPLALRLTATLTDPDDTRAAVADERGLWVATGGGLLRLPFDRPDEGRWWTTRDGLPDHRLTAIALRGELLALGTEGGAVLTLDVGRLLEGELSVLSEVELSRHRVSSLRFDGPDLYAGTWGAGVFVAGPDQTDVFDAVGPDRGIAARRVTDLAVLDGTLLAGTAGGGLWVKPVEGRARRYVAQGGLAGDFVLDLRSDGDRVWVAAAGGVSTWRRGVVQTKRAGEGAPAGLVRAMGERFYALAGGRVVEQGAERALPPCPDGLAPWHGVPHPDPRWVLEAAGRRWLGTDRGVLVQDSPDSWRWLTHDGPGSNDLTSVSAQGRRLVAGSFDRGAWTYRADAVGDGWRAIPVPTGEINDVLLGGEKAWLATSDGLVSWDGVVARRFGTSHGLLSEHVTALASAERGLWVGHSAGVQRFEGGGFGAALGDGTASHVYSVVGDGDGVWAGSLHGLWHLRKGRGDRFRYETGELPDNWVNAVTVGTDGTVWAGTYDHGLARHDGAWGHLLPGALPDGWVNPDALAPLPDGTVLVGTMGGGLLRLDKAGAVQQWTQRDGLAGDDVTSVVVDGAVVWIATRSGLSRMEVFDAQS